MAPGGSSYSPRAQRDPHANKVRFPGRLSGHSKLKPGTYTVVITATASSLTSAPHSLIFTIARPPKGKR